MPPTPQRRVRQRDLQRALNVEDIGWLRQVASGKQQQVMPDEVLQKLVSFRLAIRQREGGLIITPKGRLAVKILG
jgi:hypothetical protein